jgi:hypothetical protein
MKAVLLEQFSVENLGAAEAADLTPDQTGVFIAAEAANGNRADLAVPTGAAGAIDKVQPHRRDSPHMAPGWESSALEGHGC